MAVFPTSCATAFVAESNPMEASTNSFTMLPSMPQGTPMTVVLEPFLLKCSAR